MLAGTVQNRETSEKIAIFRQCFTGLLNVYGTYDPRSGRVRQVKQHVSDRVIAAHLRGHRPYGVYLLTGDTTRAVVADFDQEDPAGPLDFVCQAQYYGVAAYLLRSKRKGWHCWIFLELPGVSARKARLLVKAILEDIDRPETEIFPKQDRLAGDSRYGNFINAPLFGGLVPNGRTVFVSPKEGLRPYADQWEVLKGIRRLPERALDEIIEDRGFVQSQRGTRRGIQPAPSGSGHRTFGLSPCARRMLHEGVSEYQRVACFRLAVHLKKAGVPLDVATAGLIAWAAKNRPCKTKRIITRGEIIEQARSAYAGPYRGCGCEEPAVMPYCEPSCPLAAGRGDVTPANPGGRLNTEEAKDD